MSKEMMIIFVYDTECCKKEEDDPASAVLYFHPSWVSDHQRLALVGQLMGTTHFLNTIFNRPRMITLESGKFALRHFGRYILAIGTDRNVEDWIIDHRANILSSLLMLYHCSIDNIYQISTSQSTKNFKEKLYQIFETYLPILQYGGNTFCNAPTMQLPKSASNVFLEAIEILQCCQDSPGVLGGVIFYHNKIVATQLNSDITKMLVMTDPYRIKCTAETINISTELPDGVQLLQVYINRLEYQRLKELVNKYKNAFENGGSKKVIKTFPPKPSTAKEPAFSAMKRDKSIIFSTVPEEDTDQTSPAQTNNKKKFIERPRSLSLFSTTADVINNESNKKKVQTPFRSQASVCSTPIAEKVLHGNVMSICCNPDDSILPDDDRKAPATSIVEKNEYRFGKTLQDVKNSFKLKDIKTNITKFSRNVSLKYYGIGLKSMPNTPHEKDDDISQLQHCSTITDPSFPVFGNNGLPISKSLYEEQILQNYENLESDIKGTNNFKNFESDFKPKNSAQISNGKEILESELNLDKTSQNLLNLESDIQKTKVENNLKMFESGKANVVNNDKSKLSEGDIDFKKRRHSLNLPLKSLTLDSKTDVNDSNQKPAFSPLTRKQLGGVQLTPLLSKLTILAMDEKSGSHDTTPSEYRDFNFTERLLSKKKGTENLNETSGEESDSFVESADLEKVGLLICGQQNTVLMVLLENKFCQDSELIMKLWDISYNTLNQLESNLHQCIDPCSSAATDLGVDPYSYMSLDQKWDIVQRGGPWGVSELSVITHLHKDFMEMKNLCEIIVRNDESIIYGYRHGQTELFYHQNSSSNAGLPTPADLMGTVPLKAKRRLERDHAIILL